MMEFTCDGMVRYGFGFYNPNHAAALICGVMPFLWGWKRIPWLGWTLSGLLLIPLVLTYSRTGILVCGFELAAFFLLTGQRNWKWIAGISGVMVFLCLGFGLGSRFSLDGAIANRPLIWLAGLKLSAANPLGVGAGNSGLIASAFLLPEQIHCRTLVNSHLTLICEYGLIAGFFYLTVLFYALMRGIRRPAAWCALAGLTLSAFSSSIFDWHVLFDFQNYGGLPPGNFLLSWGMLWYELFLLCVASWLRPSWKAGVTASCAALICICLIFCFYDTNTPRVYRNFLIKPGSPQQMILYDEAWSLQTIRPFLPDGGYILPVSGGMPKAEYDGKLVSERIVLFGEMCTAAKKFPCNLPLYFIAPPEFAEYPDNVKGVYGSGTAKEVEVPVFLWPPRVL